jgi:hypothetical protein
MDVYNIQKYKTTILFDVSNLDENGGMLTFMKYVFAFENLMKKTKVSKAIICVDPTSPEISRKKIGNSKFIFLQKPIQDQIRLLAKKNSKSLLVCYGNIDKLVPLCKELKVKNAMFITENDISKYRDSKLLENFRFFPARILIHLGHVFWWRLTPMELIPEDLIQHANLPDKGLNEIETLSQVALTLNDNSTKILERNKILKVINDLHQEHIPSQLVQIACYLHDWKDGNLTDSQKEEVFQVIVAIFCDVNAQLNRLGAKINNPVMTDLMFKFQKIEIMLQLQYFNSEQMGIMQKVFEENRKLKGKVPRRFDYTQYNYDVPIITRK